MKFRLKKFIINLSKKNSFFRKLSRSLFSQYKMIKYLPYYLRYKVNDKVIFFEVFGGNSYACSPRAIYEYMKSDDKYKDYTFVWCFKDPDKYKDVFDDDVILIKDKSKEYYKYLSVSKYWIVNFLLDTSIIKKKEQIYVQCWHGTPLKKLRCDIEVTGAVLNDLKDIRKRNDLDVKRIDYFLSPSKFCTEKFTSAFNLENLNKKDIIIEKGYPRNDYLYKYSEEDVIKIKKKLGIKSDKKIILYAPTFRDNQHTSGVGYTYDLGLDFNNLKKLSSQYIILFRAHYFVANAFNFDDYKGFVYDVSKYDNINDLYVISDLLVTDYSSVFFDFANLKRPMLFYMYDFDEYKNSLRDFYIDIKMLPGLVVYNEDDLIKSILDSKNFKYNKKYKDFNKKFNYLDDGNASKRVVEVIFNEKES